MIKLKSLTRTRTLTLGIDNFLHMQYAKDPILRNKTLVLCGDRTPKSSCIFKNQLR